MTDFEALETAGWTVECESPFEIRHTDGSFATGQAACTVAAEVQGTNSGYISRKVMAIKNLCVSISLEDYKQLRLNSWEADYLLDCLNDDALIYKTERCIANCQRLSRSGPLSTYDEAAVHQLLPEFIRRMRVRNA